MIIDADDPSCVSKVQIDSKSQPRDDETGSAFAGPPPYAPAAQRLRPEETGYGHDVQGSSSGSYRHSPSPPSSASLRLRAPLPHAPHAPHGASRRPAGYATLRPTQSFQNLSSINSPDLPPPLSFSRSPPRHISYPEFQPIFLIASGKFLDKGFPPVAPPSNIRPHPFAVHDVNQGDWLRFLDDVRRAATLTEKQISLAEDLPIISMLPVVSTLIAHAIKSHMKRKKSEPASQAVDTWNHHFFHPRKMEVILMKGPVRLSGQNNHPIPNLHTPETVSFSLSDVPGIGSTGGLSSAVSSSGRSSQDEQDTQVKGKQTRLQVNEGSEKDKTYRLFVVSTTK